MRMELFRGLALGTMLAFAVPSVAALAATQDPATPNGAAVQALIQPQTATSSAPQQVADTGSVRDDLQNLHTFVGKHHKGHGRLALRNRLHAAHLRQAMLARIAAARAAVVHRDIMSQHLVVNDKKTVVQATACDSILCPGYAILGVGF